METAILLSLSTDKCMLLFHIETAAAAERTDSELQTIDERIEIV